MSLKFFTELKQLTVGMDLTIRIKEKNGKLTVGFTPELQNSAKIVPLTLTGTAEELDEGLMDHITGPLEETKTELQNLELHKKSVQDLVSEETKAAPKKKPAPAKKTSKPVAKKKPTKKTTADKPPIDDPEEEAGDQVDTVEEQPKEEALF